jgi:hypothetical protein
MSDEYESGIRDFLAKPENLRIALQIQKHMQSVQDALEDRFWKAAMNSLSAKIPDARLEAAWRVDADLLEGRITVGVKLIPRAAGSAKEAFHYWVAGEERKGSWQLYQGVFLPETRARTPDKIGENLRQRLLEQGYKQTKGWVAWRYFRDFASLDDFYLEIAEHGDEMAASVSQTVWDFFDATRAQVERCNAAILKAKK